MGDSAMLADDTLAIARFRARRVGSLRLRLWSMAISLLVTKFSPGPALGCIGLWRAAI